MDYQLGVHKRPRTYSKPGNTVSNLEKTDSPFIHGKWKKRISKLKASGIIRILPSTQMA